MEKKIRQLAEVVLVFRNHSTKEWGLNEFWDNELQEKLLSVGVETEIIDDETMIIKDT